ncbi:ABC transporter substrate-binding protein [Catenulispora sp. NL8]|uniref:ABC transporter substrate-binding protein n=1 Tax=Catenulispora pinistramenti TaxID=2705254 RepID=A0ABS5KSA9_9ACTN|nr:ABC transporter substrate-binding protein [Catenulispora pinistramenti]MBS2548890.1 ABC transporter substrate-binding protein [Catenulispora pinistramenti]
MPFRNPRRRAFALAAALAGAAVLSAPAAAASGPAQAQARGAHSQSTYSEADTASASSSGKTLTVGVTSTIDSLSPFLAQRALPTQIHRLMYDFLTNYDPTDDHPIGALATSWTTSADKLTWTYTIRDGMKWSDGQPVTAADAAWTYNLMMTNPDAATANGNFVANFAKVTATGNQLVITLKQPQSTMLALDVPIVPEHIWAGHVKDIGTFNNDTQFPVVGDGPFILTGYQKDQYLTLDANPDYWRGKPAFDHLVFKFYKDADSEVEALKKGEIDFVDGLTPAQYESLKGQSDIVTNDAPGKRFYALAVNPGATTATGQAFGDGSPALQNQQFRQALMYAIDTKTLVTKTLGGYGTTGSGYIPPVFSTYHWSPDPSTAYTYDPDKANQMLDAAGFKKGSDGMRTMPDGKPLNLRLMGETNRPDDTQDATYVAEFLKAVGIATTTSLVDQGKLGDTEVAGNFDLAFDSWTANPDPDAVLSIQTCATRPSAPGKTGATDDFLCDKNFDALYAKQITEYDPATRADDVKQMEQVLYTDAYINVLYYPDVLEAYRSDVIGSWDKQPQPKGVYWGQDGYWSFWSAKPAAASAASGSSSKSSSSSTGLVIGIVVVIVVVVGGGGLVLMRRRRTASAEERE